MKIYLATAAPGNDGPDRMVPIKNRLLSYYHVMIKQFNTHDVFAHIIKTKKENNK